MSILRQTLPTTWKFRRADQKSWQPARVPGCVHTDLRRAGEIPDPFWADNEKRLGWIAERDWVYRCEFVVGKNLLAREYVELVAEGLDTFAVLNLNGREIARNENMFTGRRLDVRSGLRAGKNVLEILFQSPINRIAAEQKRNPGHLPEWCDPVGGASLVRKEQCSFGWDWGPRLPSLGVWLPIYLEGWNGNRIESVRVVQAHEKSRVRLTFHPALSAKAKGKFRGSIHFRGQKVASFEGLETVIEKPRLWWPNGHGEQPLYEVVLELLDAAGVVLDTWQQKIGLRTIALDCRPDKFGESFQFVVNGRTLFAKGANWIPAHSFVTEADHALYENLLSSAVAGNMNMLRVWGGGIYEKEEFYDLCDEKGLLVWQDFMFACALYPGDKAFLGNVAAEAEFQVRRLAHRACLALWCGNNEIEQMPQEIVKTPARKKAFEALFYAILPKAVKAWDGVTPYWPGSPHNPDGYEKGHNNEDKGDAHFWDVWHARKPVKSYETKNFRFCSEFGMQSYSSPEVAATFCRPENWNVFGPEMENHQKNGSGNQIILDYVSRLYRFPKDFPALSYLSQLNQAYCMKIGVEHFRRKMPRTMGALYWQLNDCWPVASWSSIEFGGRWKALQYEARRFFAPALVSVHVPGDESYHGASNTLRSTIGEVHLHTVYDAPKDAAGTLSWTLCHLEKGRLRAGRKPVALRYGQAVRQLSLDFATEMEKYGAPTLYLRVELAAGGKILSRQTVYLTAPRYLNLQKTPVRVGWRKKAPQEYELTLTSRVFQPWTAFELPGIRHRADDNFIDLYPGEPRCVVIQTEKDLPLGALRKKLGVASLVDSYR
jgi:beta-mannosidase